MSSSIALNNYLQAQQKLNALTMEESAEGPAHNLVWTVTYRRYRYREWPTKMDSKR
ncbi:hypothetical protein K439DRAFT_350076 [Ramaria rubella]|nr:hypothetical protein K439DRAFT_350076 [Ramaria rubella]